MNFTDSTTCLVDHELSFAEADSREYGGYYNSCAVPMEGDSGDSCSLNSSSSGSQNSSLVSPDRVYFPPPQTPSPPQHHNSHRQQCCQHKGRQHQEPQQWRNSSAEERETFSDYGISARMSDHHQRLDQQQTQEMLDQHLRLEQQQHQQHHYQQQQQQQHQGMLDHHLGLKQQQQHQGTPDHHHHQQQHQQHQRQQLHNQKGRPRSQICRSDGGAGEVMFFHSAKGVWDSLAYITSLTDMCDVVFHVGKARHPVYGVKSLLSVRSRVMYLKILAAQRSASASPKSKWKRLRHRSAADNDVITDGRIHVDVKDYDAQVFSQLVGFLHSGRVTVDADTVLVPYCLNAATVLRRGGVRSCRFAHGMLGLFGSLRATKPDPFHPHVWQIVPGQKGSRQIVSKVLHELKPSGVGVLPYFPRPPTVSIRGIPSQAGAYHEIRLVSYFGQCSVGDKTRKNTSSCQSFASRR